ncbi:methionine ABC transporter ATP-binding protein [Mycolicibacterium parafortuitum]|uniref:ABC transporter [Sphaerobacter thermophilus DSM] n=1 Tax=Mycolicibacterium parafortuitum TaxID=39692 RepID=A0A375YPH4_MYCPF|nr:methionine ABC transporter ATP-binding protein [Mycolicibacterium parafortuitum]ORB28482.1 ABC transporter ATP-binding protein [Mycolicibacterium parafortuitum]SRX82949.1 ABC transporter [Sphaerobacter thermophilus DSM] [Mycolicibacterium parafortuitum]
MSIYTEDLTKVYGSTRALDGVSISVEQGAILGVVGSSGSGKSTLVRNIALLERPTRGRVVLDGQDLTALPERELRIARRRLGNVFQSANLLDNRTARANIEFPLEIAGWDRTERWHRAQQLLELVGLGTRGESYPAQLSGGQRQRIGIARALAARPSVILADEPTSALDPATTQEILGLLTDLRDELDVTILLITHDLSIVRQIADRVAVLDEGRVVVQGPLADVAADPGSGLLPPLSAPPPPADGELIVNVVAGADASASFISTLARELDTDVRIIDGEVLRLGEQTVSQFQLALSASGRSTAPDRVAEYARWFRQHRLGFTVAGVRV